MNKLNRKIRAKKVNRLLMDFGRPSIPLAASQLPTSQLARQDISAQSVSQPTRQIDTAKTSFSCYSPPPPPPPPFNPTTICPSDNKCAVNSASQSASHFATSSASHSAAPSSSQSSAPSGPQSATPSQTEIPSAPRSVSVSAHPKRPILRSRSFTQPLRLEPN